MYGRLKPIPSGPFSSWLSYDQVLSRTPGYHNNTLQYVTSRWCHVMLCVLCSNVHYNNHLEVSHQLRHPTITAWCQQCINIHQCCYGSNHNAMWIGNLQHHTWNVKHKGKIDKQILFVYFSLKWHMPYTENSLMVNITYTTYICHVIHD